MRQVIDAVFSPEERQHRLAVLGRPTIEETESKPTIYVLRRNGQKIGIGFTLDCAIADAEANLHSWLQEPKQLKCKGKYAGKAAKEAVIVCTRKAG